jgi:CBS domain-containing protein
MWWPAIGAAVVGLGGYLEPRALGVGYDVIGDLLRNHLAVDVAIGLLVCKGVMWVVALGSGTSGGVLAPLLMLGAGLGIVLGPVLPGGNEGLWPLVFMAATLGGMMRAPIMAVMFAFEVTHDANALVPLLAACAVAYGFTVLVMPRSILTEKIARRGYHIYREYGIDPLERHTVSEVMTREVKTIGADTSIEDTLRIHFGPTQSHRAFPVIENGAFAGMVDRSTLAKHAGRSPSTKLRDLFGENLPVMALPGETCRTAATRLAVHQLERLPVVKDTTSRELLGLVARSDLVKPSLALFDEEQNFEHFNGTMFTAFSRMLKRR